MAWLLRIAAPLLEHIGFVTKNCCSLSGADGFSFASSLITVVAFLDDERTSCLALQLTVCVNMAASLMEEGGRKGSAVKSASQAADWA